MTADTLKRMHAEIRKLPALWRKERESEAMQVLGNLSRTVAGLLQAQTNAQTNAQAKARAQTQALERAFEPGWPLHKGFASSGELSNLKPWRRLLKDLRLPASDPKRGDAERTLKRLGVLYVDSDGQGGMKRTFHAV